jgi:hypothetical protein
MRVEAAHVTIRRSKRLKNVRKNSLDQYSHNVTAGSPGVRRAAVRHLPENLFRPLKLPNHFSSFPFRLDLSVMKFPTVIA